MSALPKVGHVRLLTPGPVHERRLAELKPAMLNDKVYKSVDLNAPDVRALADLISAQGLLEAIVITLDDVIVSGHRRRAACKVAGLKVVPVRKLPIHSTHPRFAELLTSFNAQRVKTVAEQAREAVVLADPDSAYSDLIAYRREIADAATRVDPMAMGIKRRRKSISDAKRPLLNAVVDIIHRLKEFWPLTDRQIHYQLLNDPPLRHASKPASAYANDRASYQDLCDLLTRARLTGEVAWSAIADETRPVVVWNCHQNPGPFIKQELDGLLRGYYRDLLQSQPNHVEVVAEKLTVKSIIERVTAHYCIPTTIGRGFSSIQPRHEMVRRFRNSGKERLAILFVSDFDPEGESIAESFARSLRDDFNIEAVTPIKVALTADQVRVLQLPPVMTAKTGSSRRKGFVEQHGENVFELEALPPDKLQEYVRAAIEGVLDMVAFHAEETRERQDAVELDALRQQARAALSETGGPQG